MSKLQKTKERTREGLDDLQRWQALDELVPQSAKEWFRTVVATLLVSVGGKLTTWWNGMTGPEVYVIVIGSGALAMIGYAYFQASRREPRNVTPLPAVGNSQPVTAHQRVLSEPISAGDLGNSQRRATFTEIRTLIKFGTDTLLNADSGSNQTTWTFLSWRERVAQWMEDVIEQLSIAGAAEHEKSSFETLITYSPLGLPGKSSEHGAVRDILATRLHTLRAILKRLESNGEPLALPQAQPVAQQTIPSIDVSVSEGKSVYIKVQNKSGPFFLVMHSKLQNASRPIDHAGVVNVYVPRPFRQGDDVKDYKLVETTPDTNRLSQLYVYGEGMKLIQTWRFPVSFEIAITFLAKGDRCTDTIGEYVVTVRPDPNALRRFKATITRLPLSQPSQ